MSIPKCTICLDDCLIPVEIICFGCGVTQLKPSCFSFNRVCYLCANKYLELDRPFHQRSPVKRCIFCPAECNPRTLSEKTWYRKDFLLMQMDTSIVKCPNENCDFQDIHVTVDRHYTKDCDHTITACVCNTYVPRSEMIAHKKKCSFFRECFECSKFFLVSEYERHLQESHGMIVCMICKHLSSLTLTDHLEKECVYRLIYCTYCHKFIRSKDLQEHYIEHAVELKHNVSLLHNTIEREQTKLLKITNMCNDLHKLHYPDKDD